MWVFWAWYSSGIHMGDKNWFGVVGSLVNNLLVGGAYRNGRCVCIGGMCISEGMILSYECDNDQPRAGGGGCE